MTRLFYCFVCLAFAFPAWSQAGTRSAEIPDYQGNLGVDCTGKTKNECLPGFGKEMTSRYQAASEICRSGANYTRASISDCPTYLVESSFDIENSVQKSVLSLLIAHTYTFIEAQALLEKLEGASFDQTLYNECKTVGDNWRALAEAEATKLPRERMVGLADVNVEVQACILGNAH